MRTSSMMSQTRPTGIRQMLATLWRVGVRSWFRRVEFVIACRDLDRPPFRVLERNRPDYDENVRFLRSTTEADLPALENQFGEERVRHLKRCIAHPQIDFQSRIDEQGDVWCYIMHGLETMPDLEYGFKLPLRDGHDVYVFDGWVHPEYRGRMVGLIGANDYHELRRGEGYRRAYVALRTVDVRSRRMHWRMEYVEVGRIRHTQIGPFRLNRVDFRPGLHPTKDPVAPVPDPKDHPVSTA